MALDKNKLAAEATRYVQKSQWDKAIKAYQRILAEDPRDVRVLLKIGELQQKKGDAAEAAETLHQVASAYSEQGFFLKAVAVFKQIVKLAPGDARVHEKLAGLYQQLGIVSDAVAQLQLVVQSAEARGDDAKLFEVLGRMADLDPENAGVALKLGELHAKSGAAAPALQQLRRAADAFRRTGRTEEWARAAERIVGLEPGDLELTRELAQHLLRRGDAKRALAKLQLCFKETPDDPLTLSLLATAFGELGQVAKQVSVYRELAHVEASRGRPAESRAAWQRVAALAPGDQEADEALSATPHAAEAPRDEVVAAAADSAAASARGVASPAAARAPVRPPVEALPKLLQETEVFAKYGLYRKALDHLDKVFAADPGHLDGRERARDLCAASGDAAGAAEHGARAVELARERGDAARAEAALARLRELAPGSALLAALDAGAASAGAPAGEQAEVVQLDLDPEAFDEVSFEDFAPDEIVEPEPVPEEIAIEVAPEPDPTELGWTPSAAEAGTASEPDLGAEIEEIEFFLQQGLVDDAREAFAGVHALYPAHAALAALAARLRDAGADAAPEGFDLGKELAAELDEESPAAGALPYPVQEVMREFQRGVAASEVSGDDGDTHYDLGIAYREMGLFGDAVHEFELAQRGKASRSAVDCLTMIGLCRLDAGEPRPAIEAWRRALSQASAAEPPSALHYELSRAYEALGDHEAALWYLQKVMRAEPRFRDAQERVQRLGGGPGRPPADEPEADAAPRPAARKIGYV